MMETSLNICCPCTKSFSLRAWLAVALMVMMGFSACRTIIRLFKSSTFTLWPSEQLKTKRDHCENCYDFFLWQTWKIGIQMQTLRKKYCLEKGIQKFEKRNHCANLKLEMCPWSEIYTDGRDGIDKPSKKYTISEVCIRMYRHILCPASTHSKEVLATLVGRSH